MRVCFYSPYIPKHFGGGEKHLFDVATLVASKHQVFIAINENEKKQFSQIRLEYENFLNYSLKNIRFISSPIPTGNFFRKLLWTRNFDYFYYATDGSLFFSLAKTNNLHIQIPFSKNKFSLIDRMKLNNWKIKNTNSVFTKKIIEKNWGTKINFVHHPKVNLKEITPVSIHHKSKIILSVGRFFKQLHSKRQDALVKVFSQLIASQPKLLKDWKLVLIGNVEDKVYFNEIKKMAIGLPIEFHTDASRKTLISFYQKAGIYWHAAGYEIDEKISPEKVEHFGITTIEAMAAGCIPIVVGKGGQVEILGKELSGLMWQTQKECVDITTKIIRNFSNDIKLQNKIFKRVTNFDENEFAKKLWEMI